MSNTGICRIHVVANLLPKPATVDFVASFGNSRLSTKSTVFFFFHFFQVTTQLQYIEDSEPVGRLRASRRLRAEFNFVTSVYRALAVKLFQHTLI